MGLGVAQGAGASGDLLPDLGHADFALGAVVGEGQVGVAGEAEHLVLVGGDGLVEVLGVGFGDAPVPAADALGGGGSSLLAWVMMVL